MIAFFSQKSSAILTAGSGFRSPATWGSSSAHLKSSVPEIIDPVFAKTSQNACFLLSENERFGLVFVKTWVYKFGH